MSFTTDQKKVKSLRHTVHQKDVMTQTERSEGNNDNPIKTPDSQTVAAHSVRENMDIKGPLDSTCESSDLWSRKPTRWNQQPAGYRFQLDGT